MAGRCREGCTGGEREWRQRAVHREEWASVTEGAKVLGAPYSQAVSTQIKKNEMWGHVAHMAKGEMHTGSWWGKVKE